VVVAEVGAEHMADSTVVTEQGHLPCRDQELLVAGHPMDQRKDQLEQEAEEPRAQPERHRDRALVEEPRTQ
jgi:hypothetical protein